MTRDAHVGTRISNASLADWGQLSATRSPSTTGYMPWSCSSAQTGAIVGPDGRTLPAAPRVGRDLRNRARGDHQLPAGRRAKVYWLTVPLPRDPARQRIASVVNRASSRTAANRGVRRSASDTDDISLRRDLQRFDPRLTAGPKIVRSPDGIPSATSDLSSPTTCSTGSTSASPALSRGHLPVP